MENYYVDDIDDFRLDLNEQSDHLCTNDNTNSNNAKDDFIIIVNDELNNKDIDINLYKKLEKNNEIVNETCYNDIQNNYDLDNKNIKYAKSKNCIFDNAHNIILCYQYSNYFCIFLFLYIMYLFIY